MSYKTRFWTAKSTQTYYSIQRTWVLIPSWVLGLLIQVSIWVVRTLKEGSAKHPHIVKASLSLMHAYVNHHLTVWPLTSHARTGGAPRTFRWCLSCDDPPGSLTPAQPLLSPRQPGGVQGSCVTGGPTTLTDGLLETIYCSCEHPPVNTAIATNVSPGNLTHTREWGGCGQYLHRSTPYKQMCACREDGSISKWGGIM